MESLERVSFDMVDEVEMEEYESWLDIVFCWSLFCVAISDELCYEKTCVGIVNLLSQLM